MIPASRLRRGNAPSISACTEFAQLVEGHKLPLHAKFLNFLAFRSLKDTDDDEFENSLHICIYPHICKVRFAKEHEIYISICVCIYLSFLISD